WLRHRTSNSPTGPWPNPASGNPTKVTTSTSTNLISSISTSYTPTVVGYNYFYIDSSTTFQSGGNRLCTNGWQMQQVIVCPAGYTWNGTLCKTSFNGC